MRHQRLALNMHQARNLGVPVLERRGRWWPPPYSAWLSSREPPR